MESARGSRTARRPQAFAGRAQLLPGTLGPPVAGNSLEQRERGVQMQSAVGRSSATVADAHRSGGAHVREGRERQRAGGDRRMPRRAAHRLRARCGSTRARHSSTGACQSSWSRRSPPPSFSASGSMSATALRTQRDPPMRQSGTSGCTRRPRCRSTVGAPFSLTGSTGTSAAHPRRIPASPAATEPPAPSPRAVTIPQSSHGRAARRRARRTRPAPFVRPSRALGPRHRPRS